MEKIINIGGVDVRLVSTAATPLIYKKQFKTSFMTDLMLLSKAFQNGTDISKMSYNQIRNVDLDIFYNFVWVLAKGADKNIEPNMTIAQCLDYVQEWIDLNTESEKTSSRKATQSDFDAF